MSDREFRKKVFEAILKEAGRLTDTVSSALGAPSFRQVGSVGAGTSVMAPPNPVKSDGTVDIIIQIRGISGGDTKTATRLGKNAVVVTTEAGGLGSKENLAAYGNPGFITDTVNKVLASLRKDHPNVRLGKLTISSFSGGGSATAALIAQRDKLPKGSEAPKFVFLDGLHTEINSSTMKAIVDYANQVKKDPKAGELAIVHTAVHTAVVPGKYHSTTDTADHILSNTGVARKPTGSNQEGQPVSTAQSGGLKIIQLYDRKDPYMVVDPKTGKPRPNIPGTAGYQHIKALDWGLRNVV